MTELQTDLLNEPWITTEDGSGRRQLLDLGQVLARLGEGEPLEFPSLQSSQRQAWHAFLVQLAALALVRGDSEEIPREADSWRQRVAALVDDPAAFFLVVEDLSRPAFFQPPVPEGNLQGFKRSSASPQILDVLITAKNFDVKADRFTAPATAEHWAFALITLQTMQGFLGRGNYGIARMNGGFASRPEVALARSLGNGERFVRDLRVLLEEREVLLEVHEFTRDGAALLWTLPWAGEKKEVLGAQALDPFFLEVCRRVRLTGATGGLRACIAPTKAPRVDAKEQLGNLGDPWTPVRIKDGAALTVSEKGFHYQLVQDLLLGSAYKLPAALKVRSDDAAAGTAVFRVLARGQGKTGGLHQRELLIPARVRLLLGKVETRNQLAVQSKARVEKASEMRLRVLRPALLVLGQERVDRAPGQKLDYKDQRPAPWLERFDREVDRVFFEELFRDLEAEISTEERHERWNTCLRRLVRPIFAEALETLAPRGIHRYRAVAKAKGLFDYLCRKNFPEPSSPEGNGATDDPTAAPPTATPKTTRSETNP